MAHTIFHVVGALVTTVALSFLALFIDEWLQRRHLQRRKQELSLVLGVSIASLENDEALIPQIIQYSSKRFSEELLRNRFSDLCGYLIDAWGWLLLLLQAGIVIGVGWSTYSSSAENAVYMWLLVVVAIFFGLASVAFSSLCLLLTGRYPGEPKTARKSLSALIEQRSASTARRSVATLEAVPDS